MSNESSFYQYLPPGVTEIIAMGGGCWIGRVDESTVLKYPHRPQDQQAIRIEGKMLAVLGTHPHIVQLKGLREDGLLLEYAANGDLKTYLASHPEVSLEQRLAWCIQATEALAHAHSRRVLHCDLRHDNLLLDAELNIKLADFQGQHFSPAGTVLLDGLSVESTKAYLPRTPPDHATVKTDLFALGGVIHFIMVGGEIYPDLDHARDEDEIERRFIAREFPTDTHPCASVTSKCWRQLYGCAGQVLSDLRAAAGGVPPDGEAAMGQIAASALEEPSSETSWLSGLCEDEQALGRRPPPVRSLTDAIVR